MSKPTTNNIDVSEEIRYCNNCSNLGLDFKTGKFYCGLSNRKDELPEILSCENFSSNCYIKRLQEENEGLKSLNDFNVQKIEVLQEENEKLKKKKDEYYLINLDYETKISYLIQALEEIMKEIGDLKNINRLINLQKILDIINEVLNDRD